MPDLPASTKPSEPAVIRLFGIRHHGPGSARRLMDALQTWAPDILLVECPADGQDALDHIGDPGLVPPVALLIHHPDSPGTAAHLPFARFSPEWQACRYATAHHLPVVAIDLPWGIQKPLETGRNPGSRQDPFAMVARQMGYEDTERWWEYFFEQVHGPEDLFPAIGQLMSALRMEDPGASSGEEVLREAWMRRSIREYRGRGYRRIAVVCGAWHVPALEVDDHDARHDQDLLESLRIRPASSTWIPWTYGHLATRSGYGAGVPSPAWYELLFEHPEGATVRWMTSTTGLLRKKGFPAAPASVPPAVEMAEALAGLRGMHQPGYPELEDAARAVLAEGDPGRMDMIREANLIGDRMGKVPPSIPRTPLQEDFHREVTSARLKRAWETPGKVESELDLRKPANRRASVLLHRLNLLDLAWGNCRSRSDGAKGGARERWVLQWKKAHNLRLLEAGLWGETVAQAAQRYTLDKADRTTALADLANWLRTALDAELPELASELSRLLMSRSAGKPGITDLMLTLTPLVQIHRFGHHLKNADLALDILLDRLVVRIRVGLPGFLHDQSEDQAIASPGRIRQFLTDLQWLERVDEKGHVLDQLVQTMQETRIHPYLHGALTRLMLEEGRRLPLLIGPDLRTHVVRQPDIRKAADWASGLLTGPEALLLRQKDLWPVLDEWISGIEEVDFPAILPTLRRAFRRYSASARRQVALRARARTTLSGPEGPARIELNEDQRAWLIPALGRWLGSAAG